MKMQSISLYLQLNTGTQPTKERYKMENLNKTIVAFHIGRGGRFHNQGHLSFIGENKIGDFVHDLFLNFENEKDFSNRFGFDSTGGEDQKSILDLITDRDFDQLKEKFGITELMLGLEQYYDGGGNPVGLTVMEEESGIGTINIDNDYDTTYTIYLEDASENEIEAIRKYQGYKGSEVESFLESLNEENNG